MVRKKDALAYHAEGRRGKIEVVPTKPISTQRDLSLAYTPGVAEPSRVIADDPSAVDRYTARRNLVAVVSNGTAVLGLGDVGPRWNVTSFARSSPRRVVFPEGEVDAILRAAEIVAQEHVAQPVLIGRPPVMRERAHALGVDLDGAVLVDTDHLPGFDRYAEALFSLRARHGVTLRGARRRLEGRLEQGLMMLCCDDVDGLVAGWDCAYPDAIRPALQIIGVRDDVRRACGCYLVLTANDVKLLADTTMNIDPDAETLAETAILTAALAEDLGIFPRVALLSFSNFGDAPHPSSRKVARAVELVRRQRPDLMVDGEMQADVALREESRRPYPFSALEGSANVLVFPSLDAGNIGYKLLSALGSEVVGPIVLGMKKPVNVLQQGANVSTIVHMTSLTVAHAIRLSRGG